ncbi:hypothetical protein Q9L42_012875 [Methylomarinum sp. Ch1-1]|uniref:Immunity protein 30 domain-containing protein n=1 Tax=Methylomarinum roseum TaxID=3067653 RepID=A0AAU7NQK1_9GAMM|nr:hypothetical protein [Methylomarinum sp. Ch1-1]MDP4520788.1 hypothetical protein [Methylomarinum sp. Ch1-1]
MSQLDRFEQLKVEFNLKDSDFYFLDLIPLIDMIWADGINQEGELKILYQFVIEHIAKLDQLYATPVISVADANSFLDRFAHQKPDRRLLGALTTLFLSEDHRHRQTILDYCMDIAAACTTQYPFGMHERVVREEKQLLEKLIRELNIAPERKGPYTE